ncbi:MAG: hypothetical protein KDD05_03120 [Psychroserpens sp.]|nr:hypothetical protein [Psychroserpens sp.]
MILFFGAKHTEAPVFSISNPKESIIKFKSYYIENFGLKTALLDSYLQFKTNVLNDNPLPNRVLTGKDGWYFLGNHYNNLFDDSFGNHALSLSELEIIKNNIKTIKENLESKNIVFQIVVPPNKHRLYTENLPYRLNQNPTRLQQINSYLKKEIDFEILDLRDTLYAHKESEQLYFKTNTHWNDIAAYIGYYKTISSLNLDIPVTSISNYNFDIGPIKRGDITEMIHIKSDESTVYLSQKTASELVPIKSEYHHLHFKNPNRKRKLIMYRDSFSNAWIKFFNSSFGETIYFRDYNIKPDIIDKEQPDVVIVEVIERQLSTVLLSL